MSLSILKGVSSIDNLSPPSVVFSLNSLMKSIKDLVWSSPSSYIFSIDSSIFSKSKLRALSFAPLTKSSLCFNTYSL
jgi:hypothetical protein